MNNTVHCCFHSAINQESDFLDKSYYIHPKFDNTEFILQMSKEKMEPGNKMIYQS